jgi:hypothetical protein
MMKLKFSGAAGDIVSLLPLGAVVEGVLTTDLQFPLRRADTLS